MLFIDNLSTEYLRNVTYHFSKNSLNVVLGPSGSGKTTLLRCIAGLQKHSKHSIRWSEKVSSLRFVASSLPEELTKLTFREIMQYHNCKHAEEWAQQFRIHTELIDTLLNANILSTGEQRLMSIAIGLYNVPPQSVVLIDELTNGLSGVYIAAVLSRIRAIQIETGSLIICAMHQPTPDILRQFDRVYVLSNENKTSMTPAQALEYAKIPNDPEANLLALFSTPTQWTDLPTSRSSPATDNKEESDMMIPSPQSQATSSECDLPKSRMSAVGFSRDLSNARKRRLTFAHAVALHAKLKIRSPGLLVAAFLGAAFMAALNLFLNYNNHYVAPVVPSNPVTDFKSLHLDNSVFSKNNSTSKKGFSLFDGDIANNAETQEFVQKLSYSMMSSVVFGLPTYDRRTGVKLQSAAMQPLITFISEIDKNRLRNMTVLIKKLLEVVTCAGETLATDRTALDMAPIYNPYVDVFAPDALDFVALLHKTVIVIDVFTLEQLDIWRSVQTACLFKESDALSLYICILGKVLPIANALTDCLKWPRIAGLASAGADLDQWREAVAAGAVDSLEDEGRLRPVERRQLSPSARIASSAWTDLHETLTFANDPIMQIFSRILTPSGGSFGGLGFDGWCRRLETVLKGLNSAALRSCRYTICQLPLLIWPYVISAARDFLKLVWLDVGNIALLFVLTAVVGCTALEAALSFGDLRQVSSFYNCHSQHYWLRSVADSVIVAIPAFILGSVVSASLRIRADNLWVSAAVSGSIAMLGALSACALTTAIASLMKDKVKSLLLSAVVLSLFLLLNGFLLNQEHSNVVVRVLGYLSMFQYTFKALVKNVYDHAADQQVGVMSNAFTLKFIGGIDPQYLLTVPQMMVVLTGQTVLYRLLGWFIFRSVHKTHSALVER